MQEEHSALLAAYSEATLLGEGTCKGAINKWEKQYAHAARPFFEESFKGAPPGAEEQLNELDVAALELMEQASIAEARLHKNVKTIIDAFEAVASELKAQKLSILEAFFRRVETLQQELLQRLVLLGE
jgi:hypothetical protein